MRFKVGDKVRVRDWDDMKTNAILYFVPDMICYCGKIFSVKKVINDCEMYLLDTDKDWSFTDDMLLPVDFKKSDLEDMMICEIRGGVRFFWINGKLIRFDYCHPGILENLKAESGNDMDDVVKIYLPSKERTLRRLLNHPGPLLWERKEEKEISSDEAFRVLREHYGCDVKIKE